MLAASLIVHFVFSSVATTNLSPFSAGIEFRRCRTGATVVALQQTRSIGNNNNDDDGCDSYYDSNSPPSIKQQQPKKSIGDVVQNLHGGKYQFDTPGVSFLNPIGQQFAESMYYSTNDNGDEGASTSTSSSKKVYFNEELPKWVKRLDAPSSAMDKSYPILLFNPKETNTNTQKQMILKHTITIQNEEKTWEPYYAKIIPEDELPLFEIIDYSQQGMLAPKGKHADDGVSDFATITVQLNPTFLVGYPSSSKVVWWIVVGTEEAKWYYQLQVL